MANITAENIITKDSIADLPTPVKRWLNYSGVVGSKEITSVCLKQKGVMKLNPHQKNWIRAKAKQYFTIEEPSFIWDVKTSMMGIPVIGRDSFKNGRGAMTIKLVGLFPVVKVANSPKMNEATLQRYLGEIIWFPSAALRDYITWESIDDNTARATFTYGDSIGSAIFYFDGRGQLTKFTALRYRDEADLDPTEWVARVKGYENINDLNIPTQLEISWVLNGTPFTWYKFEIYDVCYNNSN